MIGKLSQLEQLGALLRQSEIQHQVVSSNIANVNTPGHQTRHVNFDSVMEAVAKGEDVASNAKIEFTQGLVERQDGNNVDIDYQLAQLTKNAITHQTYTQLISSKLGMYRTAITGR